ncbi:NAD-dependent epimerase/dehydratase family protein [Mumia sp. DW29H23]|uniref:NAD-dependent epimerase/dehydratase family protein n=1 Tax=Mumia sp. DW29H23 TaxID=3421241 RepID=UPI003D686627
MRVFVAGATGALGSHLVPALVKASHEAVGTTRKKGGVARIEEAGATGIVMDPLDRESVRSAVAGALPDVVVHELTALSDMTGNPKRFDREFATTNRLRTEATDHLLAAAQEVGARRFVAQSYAGWPTERRGSWVKTEEDPLVDDPGREARESLAAIRHIEQAVTTAPGIEGLVLRYGAFYGPGNGLARGGAMAEMVRRGRMPVVGGGSGVWSFLHIDDAASATVAAVEHGAPGVYAVVDDDPAPVSEWLPYLAEQLGGRRPLRLPAWVARPLIGEFGIAMMTTVRGASNAKAKRELGWAPAYASWREGFRTGLG